MRLIKTFEIGPSTLLGIKNSLDMGRSENLCGYSNPLRLRHTFCTKKMRTQAGGQRELWTPNSANTPAEVE